MQNKARARKLKKEPQLKKQKTKIFRKLLMQRQVLQRKKTYCQGTVSQKKIKKNQKRELSVCQAGRHKR